MKTTLEQNFIKEFNTTLKRKGLTIVCAESITAGLLASTIASVSGASSILKGSIVTYNENLKMNILGVDPLIIKGHTAESQQTTTAMCLGLKKLYPEASIHVAVTGVASKPVNPDYFIDKEVGQVYVSIFLKKKDGYILKECETILNPETTEMIGEDKELFERNSIRTKTVEFIFSNLLDLIVGSPDIECHEFTKTI